MDQSDKIRALQAKTIFTYYKRAVLSPQATCNYSTCSSFTGCVVKYPSYAEKQQVVAGAQICNGCSGTSCGCVGGS